MSNNLIVVLKDYEYFHIDSSQVHHTAYESGRLTIWCMFKEKKTKTIGFFRKRNIEVEEEVYALIAEFKADEWRFMFRERARITPSVEPHITGDKDELAGCCSS